MNAQLIADNFENIRNDGAALYQMKPCGNAQMMGYVIRTRDGRLFCVDGGSKNETETLLALCRAAVRCPASGKLTIDGWFLTHPHYDHIDVFMETVRSHLDTVDIKTVYYNFPPTAYQETYEKEDAYTSREFDAIRKTISPFECIVHRGNSFDFGTVRFDILSEPDETITVDTGNNSSVCIRMTLEGQTVLFLGDMGAEAGKKFLETSDGEAIRSDFVEMAHHGQNGVDFSVYQAIAPKACFWCAPDWLWTNNAGQGYGTGPWKTLQTRCFMYDLGVKHHFVEKDGIWEVAFPFAFD